MKIYTATKVLKSILLLIGIFVLIGCDQKKEAADLVLTNGQVVTVDSSNPKAQAIAIKSGKILAVGSNKDIKKLVGDSTKVIDLNGHFAMPGFMDSHAHFLGTGMAKIELDLRSAKNWDEIIYLVASAADNSKPGDWIVGRGWHQEKWDPVPSPNINGYPFHNVLSKAVPYNPVLLKHASGHALFANEKAMELAGITKDTPNPRGGKIIRDSLGNAIGVFEEEAMDLITKAYNEYLDKRPKEKEIEEKIKAYELANKECIRKGITSFEDAGSTFEEVDLIKRLIDEGKINVRLDVMLLESNKNLEKYIKNYKILSYANHHLTVRAIKKYMDGALGSRGAWMLSPYNDVPTTSGLNVTPLSDIRKTAQIAIENGFQLCTHAIGDKANREILNVYEAEFKKHPNKKDIRWRIEHAQHVSPKDQPRFAKLGVIATMQGIHCTSDAVFVEKRLGKWRAKKESYAWRSLLNLGTVICNGTDSPVEDVNPIPNFYATVTRKTKEGWAFYPEQKMTREEALRSYTINSAYATFEEYIKGSLTPGKVADIVVLSKNIMTVPESEILNAKVLYTIIDGKIVYERK